MCGWSGGETVEVSPLLAYDTKGSVAAATTLHKKANRPKTHSYILTCLQNRLRMNCLKSGGLLYGAGE